MIDPITRNRQCNYCAVHFRDDFGDEDICPSCKLLTLDSDRQHRKEIRIEGTNYEEVSKVARDLMKIPDKHPLLTLLTHWSFWFGTLLVLMGVALILMGSTGETEFTFFGQRLKSQNVGITSFFIGAALVVLNVRRILSSHDKLIGQKKAKR